MKRNKKRTKVIIATTCASIALLASFYFIHLKFFFDLDAIQVLQNIASPNTRYIKITEGMRKEEVAERFAKTLGWSGVEKQSFLDTYALAVRGKSEGYLYPATYLMAVNTKPKAASQKILDTFTREVTDKEEKLIKKIINMDTAIKIASLIQREASDKNDMKIISGIIWNRLFEGMPLGIDATLQYAKGKEGKWWPQVKPEDKKIVSPFNTYKNKGLPPSAISNPGKAAIDAALNPTLTKALYYLHDDDGNIRTATTYQGHLANIEKYYR